MCVHPHRRCTVVRYFGAEGSNSHTHTEIRIFMEYMPLGSIAALLKRTGPLSEPLVRSYMRQTIAGVAYLHAQRIVHCDIKAANLLVDHNVSVRASFGLPPVR